MGKIGLSTVQQPDENGNYGVHVGGPTSLELALYAMLESEGIEFVTEWNIPGSSYSADAYDPKTKTMYEADGPHHFTPKGRHHDRVRDRFALHTGHVTKIVRLRREDLAPWL